MDLNFYKSQLDEFVANSISDRPEFTEYKSFPCLNDNLTHTDYDTHYIYHVAWAIQKIFSHKPDTHIDVSSSLNFCTSICSVVPTTFIDYRPASLYLNQLQCVEGNLTDNSQWIGKKYKSLSCMHVVEHIGLGRYGDELDVNGDIKAMQNLERALDYGGRLLFVVPVGRPQIFFNAHRVYSSKWVVDFFEPKLKLAEFYFIPGPTTAPPLVNCDLSYSDDFEYGCGCFEFFKF